MSWWELNVADWLKILGGVLVGGGILAVGRSALANRPAIVPRKSPVPSPYPILSPTAAGFLYGVDVSAAQGPLVDWTKAKASASLSFAIAKATQGEPGHPYGFVDGTFARNRAKMIETLSFWGGYHYAILSLDAVKQADAFCTQLGEFDDRMLPPSVDLEWTYNDGKTPKGSPFPATTPENTLDWLYKFDKRVRERTGRRSMCYTSAGWWYTYGKADPIQESIALWVANWTDGTKPLMPKGWAKWMLWQFSAESGPLADVAIDGIPGAGPTKKAVDRNRFAGSLEDMHNFVMASKV